MELKRFIEQRHGGDFSIDELKNFIAANSEDQLKLEINQVLNHGLGGFFPLLQMVQILYEKGGWDSKSWTKELDSGRSKVGQSIYYDYSYHHRVSIFSPQETL
jgi:hypothetical protein